MWILFAFLCVDAVLVADVVGSFDYFPNGQRITLAKFVQRLVYCGSRLALVFTAWHC